MKIAEYMQKNADALPQELANILTQETSIWTNDACYGYCIIALKAAGCTKKKINEVLHCLHLAFDEYTVEEAEKKWMNN